jgi:hypothetical protein
MDEVNIILLCSGVVVGLLAGCSWYFSDKVSNVTCCNMYTPINTVEDI